MRFHVVGLASTQTTVEYLTCAYTQKVRNFCKMMMARGHEVFLYSGDQNDTPCTEHIVCISEASRAAACNGHFHNTDHSPNAPHWMEFNARAIGAMGERMRKKDFLCVIFGMAQKPIADALGGVLKTVEYGVGYHYTFAEHRCFESYAWMHTVYGAENKPYQTGGAASDRDGIYFDEVINGYIDPDQFELAPKKSDFLLYLGRMIDRKGTIEAVEIAKATGRRLIGAGPGTAPQGMHHVGEIDWRKRRRLLSRAYAVLMPTRYIEPFGNVAIEAMASGTPVITTDWGAFTETVVQGVTGYRCRSLQEYVDAVASVDLLCPAAIRQHALSRYSMDVIGYQYEAYFKRLHSLWGGGYYELRTEEIADVN